MNRDSYELSLCLVSYDPVGKRVNISGIGHVQSGDKTTAAAKDPDKALIGRGKVQNKQDITKYYDVQQLGWWDEACVESFKNADWRQLPLAIHMGCWKLVQWQLGASVETHLELFAAIMLNISAKDRSPTLGATWFTFDAYRILKVKELIESSRLSKKRKRTRRYPGHTWFHRLPTELLDSILDGLTCKEIQKLETGLGMIVSDRYWRRRAAKNIIEMDEISGEDLNWRYLCRKWEWISKSQDFRNYHYIMGVLRDQVKPVFLKNLTERKFPCLKDVVAAI